MLGPLEVTSEGGPLALGGPKQRALLALLLLDAGRAVSTDRLVEALWGEQPPRTAATSLQNFVSQLRKVLGAGRARHEAARLRAPRRPGQLDLDRVRAPRRRRAKLEPANERAQRSSGEALTLWRGPAARRLRATRPSRRARSRGSRSCGWRRSRSGSTPSSSSGRHASSSASSRRSSRSTRCGSGCGGS